MCLIPISWRTVHLKPIFWGDTFDPHILKRYTSKPHIFGGVIHSTPLFWGTPHILGGIHISPRFFWGNHISNSHVFVGDINQPPYYGGDTFSTSIFLWGLHVLPPFLEEHTQIWGSILISCSCCDCNQVGGTLNLQDDQNWEEDSDPPNPPEELGEPLPWYLPHC